MPITNLHIYVSIVSLFPHQTEYPTEAEVDSGSADDTDVEHLDVDHAVVDYADVVAQEDSFRDFSDEDYQMVSFWGSWDN